MMNSHISAIERSLKPSDGSPALWTYSRFELDQSPVMYGITMKMNSGTISSTPVVYPTHKDGLTPRTLNDQTQRITKIAISWASPKSANPRLKYASPVPSPDLGNHSATMSAPTMFPTNESTTDQPIQ